MQFRALLRERAGGETFDLWFADLAPIAVSNADGALLIAGRRETHRWIAERHRGLFSALSCATARPVRLAEVRELVVHDARRDRSSTVSPRAAAGAHAHDHDSQEAV